MANEYSTEFLLDETVVNEKEANERGGREIKSCERGRKRKKKKTNEIPRKISAIVCLVQGKSLVN